MFHKIPPFTLKKHSSTLFLQHQRRGQTIIIICNVVKSAIFYKFQKLMFFLPVISKKRKGLQVFIHNPFFLLR